MSISNFITNLLQLKDLNITFSDHFTKVKKKGILYNMISGVLTYTPTACSVCGSVNENFSIIKNGTKSSDIKLLPCNGNPTILRLRKQRYFCKECSHTFSAETNIVETNCFISKQVKLHILRDLKLKVSEKDIAYMNFVSHSTVSRAIDKCFTEFTPDHSKLPTHLMFDEFKSTRDAKGSMSFVFADASSHQIVDIVENRQLPELRKYFSKYSKDTREKVETVCIDMYAPYMSLLEEYFPKADIIIDRFHIVQLLNRSLQRTRIDTMKNYATSSMEYKRLKRYWKLISKKNDELNSIDFKHKTHFKSWVSEKTIVEETIAVNDTFKNSYNVYQLLLQDIKKKDKLSLEKHLNSSLNSDISDYLKTAIKTLVKHKCYISNSLDYTYSNGAIEGLNNYIKVIKRIAFGYRSFVHFRNRILISKNLIKPIEKYQAECDISSHSA